LSSLQTGVFAHYQYAMDTTILITGANGFIGSHFTQLMESLGHRVVPLDVLPRSADLSLLAIQTPSRIMNVTDEAPFRELCRVEQPTHIFHAAHPPRDDNPGVLNFCYRAMTNILEAARELNLSRVVYSSSGALYGQLRKKDHLPIKENDPVAIYPTFFYRSAKIMSEWIGDFYKEKFGVPFVALRYSSVYGPGLGRGIPLELKKGVLGEPCRPYLTRLPDDLIYIDDVTDAVRRALFTERPLSRAYNIAFDKTVGNQDLTDAIRKALPDISFEIGKHPHTATVGAHRDRDPLDVSRAKEELDWRPTTDLENGIARIADWLKSHANRLK
jgi:nucleoside-diphosphate-sugar epimerase